jgi:signal transduction histidine kinase
VTHDQVDVALIAAGWAGAVGVLGIGIAWVRRTSSLRWMPVMVSVVGVGSVVAGVIATARAMFLSSHDYGVILLVCLVAGLVSFVFSLLLGTALVHWSGQLRESARTFGESGRYDARISGPAEFAALSDQLRETSMRLAASRDRERMLEESRRELVSWVSHDLRTPLAGMRAMAEALEDGMVEDPGRFHRQIRAEVDRTVRMVDDLFELSQIHAGLLVPDLQPVALGDLVSESLAGAEPIARAQGVHLSGRVQDGVVLDADPGSFSRVLANLLMNAIRHTPADGAVTIEGRLDDGWVTVEVSDACGGIPGEEIGRVFDVAFRGEAARTPDVNAPTGGAGLGLAIVRGIVEAHRGRVAVDNVGPGCRFRVLVPAAP